MCFLWLITASSAGTGELSPAVSRDSCCQLLTVCADWGRNIGDISLEHGDTWNLIRPPCSNCPIVKDLFVHPTSLALIIFSLFLNEDYLYLLGKYRQWVWTKTFVKEFLSLWVYFLQYGSVSIKDCLLVGSVLWPWTNFVFRCQGLSSLL